MNTNLFGRGASQELELPLLVDAGNDPRSLRSAEQPLENTFLYKPVKSFEILTWQLCLANRQMRKLYLSWTAAHLSLFFFKYPVGLGEREMDETTIGLLGSRRLIKTLQRKLNQIKYKILTDLRRIAGANLFTFIPMFLFINAKRYSSVPGKVA